MASALLAGGYTVLVTGGATGIGYALAEKLVKAGNKVIISGRRLDRLKEAQSKLGDKVFIKENDVSVEKERVALVKYLSEEFPSLDAVILNAGIQKDVNFLPEGTDDWAVISEEIKINLDAPIHLSKLFIPLLQKQKKDTFIMTVTSGLGFVPMSTFPVYCATKAAIHSFSLSLRYQLRNTNVKVIEIVPPAVDSELNSEGRAKRGITSTGTTSEQFATGVFEGFEKNEVEIGYGFSNAVKNASRAEVDGFFGKLNPK